MSNLFFILSSVAAFFCCIHALPLPRNVSSANAVIASVNVHDRNGLGSFPVSTLDRHRRDIDFDGNDLDGLGKEGSEYDLKIEVDLTGPPVDDELLRFNNALEQALDYLSTMESNVIEFNLDNAHPVTATEL